MKWNDAQYDPNQGRFENFTRVEGCEADRRLKWKGKVFSDNLGHLTRFSTREMSSCAQKPLSIVLKSPRELGEATSQLFEMSLLPPQEISREVRFVLEKARKKIIQLEDDQEQLLQQLSDAQQVRFAG